MSLQVQDGRPQTDLKAAGQVAALQEGLAGPDEAAASHEAVGFIRACEAFLQGRYPADSFEVRLWMTLLYLPGHSKVALAALAPKRRPLSPTGTPQTATPSAKLGGPALGAMAGLPLPQPLPQEEGCRSPWAIWGAIIAPSTGIGLPQPLEQG